MLATFFLGAESLTRHQHEEQSCHQRRERKHQGAGNQEDDAPDRFGARAGLLDEKHQTDDQQRKLSREIREEENLKEDFHMPIVAICGETATLCAHEARSSLFARLGRQ